MEKVEKMGCKRDTGKEQRNYERKIEGDRAIKSQKKSKTKRPYIYMGVDE